MRVHWLGVDQVEAVEIGQDVRRLLEEAMKLIESNRSSMEESSLIGMRLHLEVQCRGQAAEVAGWIRADGASQVSALHERPVNTSGACN